MGALKINERAFGNLGGLASAIGGLSSVANSVEEPHQGARAQQDLKPRSVGGILCAPPHYATYGKARILSLSCFSRHMEPSAAGRRLRREATEFGASS